MDIEVIRTEFADAYKAWVREGWRLRELLLQRRLTDSAEALKGITEQQKRVTQAKQRYEAARVRYVGTVLGEQPLSPSDMEL